MKGIRIAAVIPRLSSFCPGLFPQPPSVPVVGRGNRRRGSLARSIAKFQDYATPDNYVVLAARDAGNVIRGVAGVEIADLAAKADKPPESHVNAGSICEGSMTDSTRRVVG